MMKPCPDCGGEGAYIGLHYVEDPCEMCHGKGQVHTTMLFVYEEDGDIQYDFMPDDFEDISKNQILLRGL
jgi:RecJ-like exonuclease